MEIQENPSDGPKAKAVRRIGAIPVHVTKEIIDYAIRAHSGHCVVADGIKAAAVQKGLRLGQVLVDLQTIRFTDRNTGTRYIYFTPRVGQEAVLHFDRGDQLEPFKFTLRAPAQIIDKTERAPAGARKKATVKVKVEKAKGKAHGGTKRPVKFGGSPIPLMGNRREFGLRGMTPFAAISPDEAETK